MNSLGKTESAAGWNAKLGLRFVANERRTTFERVASVGPLSVQKPFYPEGYPCHVYLLHPPGGVVGGDSLHVDLQVTEGAHTLMTTPAATKFYRSIGPTASQTQMFNLAANATLEWLPQEALFFNGCQMTGTTRVYLGERARYIGWEISCLGQPVSNVPFVTGSVDQRQEIYQQPVGQAMPRPLVLERNLWSAGASGLHARWGLNGYPVMGTLFATPFDNDQLQAARAKLFTRRLLAEPNPRPENGPKITAHERLGQTFGELTLVNGVLIARVLALGAEPARYWLESVWQEIRPLVVGRTASAPAIWRT